MKIFAILIFGTTAIKSINELVSDIQKHKAGLIKGTTLIAQLLVTGSIIWCYIWFLQLLLNN
jgi:hypothetical protein